MDQFRNVDLLIVDDDPEVIHQILECFASAGLDCASDTDPIHVLQEISAGLRANVVLTDLRMPDLDGLHFARRLGQLAEEVRPEIIFMSGHANLDDAIEAIRLGAHDLLLKPVDRDKLIGAVESALSFRRGRAAAAARRANATFPRPSVAAKSENVDAKREALAALREVRKIRGKHLPEELFSDPCWEMLLDLYECHLTATDVTVTGLGVMSGAALSTALRRMHELQAHELIDRVEDRQDKRRTYVRLTDKGLSAVDSFFESYLRRSS